MNIVVNPKHLRAVQEALVNAHRAINKESITVNGDKNVESAVMLIEVDGRVDVPWFPELGLEGVLGYLSLGYVPVADNKACPMRRGKKCMGRKCVFYLIQRNIGDCASVWAGVK